VIDGLDRLMRREGFGAGDIAHVEAKVPPLNFRLVGRPDVPAPEANYAKLCLRFVAGRFLATGRVDIADFRGAALTDPETHRLAALVDVVLDASNPDQNALDPQTITVRLHSGAVHAVHLARVYGHPDVPLSAAENEAKFRRCAAAAIRPLPDPDRLIAAVAAVENKPDIAELARLSVAGAEA
jgi:2-methylcitrate dehydratase PrpD